MQRLAKGTWVEIYQIVLSPEERSDRLPLDTKKVPYEMRAKGFLLEEAGLLVEVQIETLSGRIISGKLIQQEPAYDHGFGPPIYELMHIVNHSVEDFRKEKRGSSC